MLTSPLEIILSKNLFLILTSTRRVRRRHTIASPLGFASRQTCINTLISFKGRKETEPPAPLAASFLCLPYPKMFRGAVLE